MTDDSCTTAAEPPPASPRPRGGGRRAPYRLARGASPWLIPAGAVAMATALATRRSLRWGIVAVPAVTLAGLMVWFFRDPERTGGPGKRVLAPADGVVQSIDVQADGRTRVATFMSPLNVHVNRAPMAGTVKSVARRPGGYVPAFNKDSERNERVVWHFDTEIGDLEVVQIAGTLARRIIPYVGTGHSAEQGERIGLIRFGSRVDVYLPPGVEPGVEVGQHTLAGWTRLDRD